MSRVPRADFALSTPWSGITGKPASTGTTTIIKETVVREVTPVPSPSAGPAVWAFTWAPGTVNPLQTVTTDLDLLSAAPGSPVSVGAPYALDFGQVWAVVVSMGLVRISLTNLSTAPVTLASGTWKLVVFA